MPQTIEEKISKLESKIFESTLKDHQKLNNLGWGYGMRCTKMPSFTRTDNLQAKLKILKSIKN